MPKVKKPKGILCCGEPMRVRRTARRVDGAIDRSRICRFCGTVKITAERERIKFEPKATH
jgi:hypothetical protein